MRPLVLLICVLLVFSAGLWAFVEQEPNNLYSDSNVLWCENGSHSGTLAPMLDTDYWYFVGHDEDTVQFTLSTPIGHYVDVGIMDLNNNPVAHYFGSTGSISFSFAPTIQGEHYYVVIQHSLPTEVTYTLTSSGQFYTLSPLPSPPYDISIPNGSTNVSVETTGLSWTWGDGSGLGSWNFFFGTDPANLDPYFDFISELVEVRAGQAPFPAALAGGTTYYYQFWYASWNGLPEYTPLYSFTTGPRILPTPVSNNFDEGMGIFFFQNGFWMPESVETGNLNALITIPEAGNSSLIEIGYHDLSSVPPTRLSFRHTCLMAANYAHGYVDYSTDGGLTWAVMPASSYLGSGIYDVPAYNNPEGPCFDIGSYPVWATWSSGPNFDGVMQTETFDLSPWAGCTSFRLRFRTVWSGEPGSMAWVVDDFSIWVAPPPVPTNPFPANLTTTFGTFENITWTSPGATSYSFRLHTDPAFPGYATLNEPLYACGGLEPSTTYYWNVQAHNSAGSSEWSPQWQFTTGPYHTTRHNASSLRIANVSIGSINNNSVWNSYSYYPGLSTTLEGGSAYPIQVSLAGGYGPEAVGVWIDLDGNNVFGNSPAEFTQLAWNGSGFGGTITLPWDLPNRSTRMRVLAIHTNNTDVLTPTGIFNYGETEDYNVNILSGPRLSISPSSVNFANTLVQKQSAPQRLYFSNSGTGALDITLVGISGPDAGDCFLLEDGNSYPIHLTSNQAFVDVTHTPAYDGPHNATLLVRDNLTRTDYQIPLTATTIALNPDGAISFNAAGEYAQIPSAAPMQALSAFTIEAWLRWDGSAAYQFVTAKAYEELEIHTTPDNSLRFIPTTGVYLDAASNLLIPGTWQHIACVYDPALALGKVYVDGIDGAAINNGFNPLTQPLLNSGAPWRFGARGDGSLQLQGAMDEVRLWNRALSATEIRNLIHLRKPLDTPSLIGNWQMSEQNGDQIWEEVNWMHGSLVNLEPEDRIESDVLIINGVSATQLIQTEGQRYVFGDTRASFVAGLVDAPGYMTVTHKPIGNRVEDIPSWIITVYGANPGAGSLELSPDQQDISPYYLPESNFRLETRAALQSGVWSQSIPATALDYPLDIVSFAAYEPQHEEVKITWQRYEILSPANLRIVEADGWVSLTWDAVPGAQAYRVYGSDNPDTDFTPETNGFTNEASWSQELSSSGRFYRVVAYSEAP